MERNVQCLRNQQTVEHMAIENPQSELVRKDPMENGEVEPVVIGGMVLDINATPSVVAKPGTTTPGKVFCIQVLYALGGVARNVAECMSNLGAKPYMISAVGVDMAGNLLLEQWKLAELPTEGIRRHQDTGTAVVCHIYDGKGEVAAGVASVEAIEKFLTPKWIENFECKICLAPVLMIDANLSSPALEAACQLAAKCKTPVWLEPVSVIKSKRVASVAKYVTFASPNENELIAMANALSSGDLFSPIKKEDISTNFSAELLFRIVRPAIWILLESGIEIVVLTLGSDGVLLCSKANLGVRKLDLRGKRTHSFSRQLYETVNSSCPANWYIGVPNSEGKLFVVHFPAPSASVVRLTGAGDCLVGGTLASLCSGLNVMQSIAVGIAVAKAAVEVESNVPAEYRLSKIADEARFVYSGAKFVFSPSML